MTTFVAEERNSAPDAVQEPGPFRVSPEAVEYTGTSHRYTATVKDRKVTAQDLVAPGAFDLCTCLEPWDQIEVVFGPTPMEAQSMTLRVLTTPRKGLRKFEREAGLIERPHTVVAIVHGARKATPVWGDEVPATQDEGRPGRKAA